MGSGAFPYLEMLSEAGRCAWTALKTGTRYGGDYLVHWTNKQEAWRMQGEIYVILSPDGSLYAP